MKKISNTRSKRTVDPQYMLGFGMLKLQNDTTNKYEIIFKKGLRDALIQNILESNIIELFQKKKGNSIIPLEDIMVILHFFEDRNKDKILLIFMDDKEKDINFTNLYLLSKEIFNIFNSNQDYIQIKKFCDKKVKIPRSKDLFGIFILNPSGSPYFTKIDKKRAGLANKNIQISGFISAIITFSKAIISEDSGGNLKEINFGNQRFFTIIKNNVIFAYLVENADSLFKRYMYLIVEEFFESFEKELKQYSGNISPFENFSKNLEKYFIL